MIINQTLGRLIRVNLRQVWGNEASDFTPWLALEENLKLLGETAGIELELEAQEAEVGPFRADLLCKNTADDSWVLIENQLERTDHLHLGQLLTYAAGLEAVTIIWVAERFTEEHRAALDWLNQITGEKFAFIGLEIELWRIGDSPAAPKFNIVSSPNGWARTVQSSAQRSTPLSNVKQTQLNFWRTFKEYMEQQRSFVRCQKPLPHHAMNHPIGRSGVRLASIASGWDSVTYAWNPEIRVELVIDAKDSKSYVEQLLRQKEEIEREIGHQLVWHNPPDTRLCRIYLRRNADFFKTEEWPEQHEWLRTNLETFHKVFAPRVMRLENSVQESTMAHE
jgi:hypothetical protein